MNRLRLLSSIVVMMLACAVGERGAWAGDDLAPLLTRGPLRVSNDNPRYFADSENRIVYLTGSHSWENFQDITDAFDYQAYLDRLAALNHNFIRLWVSESIQSDGGWLMHPPARKNPVVPLPYLRTGSGVALDGGPRLDEEDQEERAEKTQPTPRHDIGSIKQGMRQGLCGQPPGLLVDRGQ